MINTKEALLIKAELVYGVSINDLIYEVIDHEPLFSYTLKSMKNHVEIALTDLYYDAARDLESIGLGSLVSIMQKVDMQLYIVHYKNIVWQLCDETEDDIKQYLTSISTELKKQKKVPEKIVDAVCDEVQLQLEARLETIAEKLNDAIVEELINA